MKTRLLILLISILSSSGYSQCFAPTTVFSSNINYYSADVNWNSTLGTHHYKIRYKEIGNSNWSYKNNIDSTLNVKLLANLNPQSDYIWQIRAHCDTINSNTSNWSVTDTFTTITTACPNSNSLFTNNINYNNATANWDTVNGADRYKIRYKILGTSTWSNLGPIYHPEDSVTIPILQQNTSYEWQVLTYHDTTNLLASLWSLSDTFTTISFVYSPFNPIVTNTLSNLECNAQSQFYLEVSQSAYEPDIGTSTITSDGGSFEIGSLNTGDSVGYAIMITTSQSINAVLKAGIIAGQNYAIINSYDSTGSLIGFFTIENANGGIKVTTTTPNDLNDYTSGYISEMHLTNLFVTPQNAGPLYFFIDIESELNDQIYDTDTVQIWCNSTSIDELNKSKEISTIFDILGRKTTLENRALIFIQYSDGRIEKRITLKE
jgi:hypothetical protein